MNKCKNGAFPQKRKYASVNPMMVSEMEISPVTYFGLLRQFVPKSQCGIRSIRKCDASTRGAAMNGLGTTLTIAAPTNV